MKKRRKARPPKPPAPIIPRVPIADVVRRSIESLGREIQDINYPLGERLQGLQRELRLFRIEYTKWRRQSYPTPTESTQFDHQSPEERKANWAAWVEEEPR